MNGAIPLLPYVISRRRAGQICVSHLTIRRGSAADRSLGLRGSNPAADMDVCKLYIRSTLYRVTYMLEGPKRCALFLNNLFQIRNEYHTYPACNKTSYKEA